MAVVELVPYTSPGGAVSADQTVADGSFATIIPVFKGRHGKVVIEVPDSDDGYQTVATLGSNPKHPNEWQLRGPLTYRVAVRDAGASVDTGA